MLVKEILEFLSGADPEDEVLLMTEGTSPEGEPIVAVTTRKRTDAEEGAR
ncbi:MAG: hypothetical protein AB7K71_36585 [Polyangiaceae bacterium]